jgi:hypothetical protein
MHGYVVDNFRRMLILLKLGMNDILLHSWQPNKDDLKFYPSFLGILRRRHVAKVVRFGADGASTFQCIKFGDST